MLAAEDEGEERTLGDYVRSAPGLAGSLISFASISGAITLLVIGALDWQRDLNLLIAAGLIATFYFAVTWVLDEAFRSRWDQHAELIDSRTEGFVGDLDILMKDRRRATGRMQTLVDRSVESERLLDDIHARLFPR